MKYRLDYTKKGLHAKKYLEVSSNLEALAKALELTRSSEDIKIIRLENTMTGEFLIKKPDLALDVLAMAAEQLAHHLDEGIIDKVNKDFAELVKVSS